MSNTKKENIAEMLGAKLTERKQERAKLMKECETEKAAANAKIEALKIEHDNAETPGAYKATNEQMQEQKNYIAFLDKRCYEATSTPLITREEYNEIARALNEENTRVLDASAAQILKKYDELISLMEEYATTADEMQAVLNQAQKAHFKRTLGGHMWHALEDKRADNNSFFGKFCRTYFDFFSIRERGRV